MSTSKYTFLNLLNDIELTRRKAERAFKKTKYALGSYEDGYLSALNYTITLLNMYIETVRHEVEEENKHDSTRN